MVVRIAVDAMGGDYAPREVVHGAVLAAREYGVHVQLVGQPEAIAQELKRHDTKGLNIKLVPASEIIGMDENPSRAVLKKKDSSIVVATRQVAEGKADGVVAAGSTGAAAVAAQITLGRVSNLDRAPIACMMPTINPDLPALLLDVGANKDCEPKQLVQFALMGSLLFEGLFDVEHPRVGVLNIGTEESKGTQLVQEAYKLLKQHPKINFIGFVEGRDFPMGKVDVTVTDGFTGNNVLKTSEGIARMITVMLKQELKSSIRCQLGAKIVEPALLALKRRIDYNEFGGALLLGVKGVYVIAHGGSKHTAMKNAVRMARDMVKTRIVQRIQETISPDDAIAPQETSEADADTDPSSGDKKLSQSEPAPPLNDPGSPRARLSQEST